MLKKMNLGVLGANCYICYHENQQAIIIDPGDEPRRITRFLKEHELNPVGIFLTHGHIDHIGALSSLHDSYIQTPVYIHEEDLSFLSDPKINLSQQILNISFIFKGSVLTLKHQQTIKLNEFEITCLHFPGHTPGSCMYALEPEHLLFSGDVLFADSIGRYDLPLGSHSDTKESLSKIIQLDDSYSVYPGHGEATTMKQEKQQNPYLKTA